MTGETEIMPGLLVGLVVLAAARLAWVDLRRLEIELETLVVLAVLGLLHGCATDPPAIFGIRVFAGFAFWGLLVLTIRAVPDMTRMGAGDPPLIGVLAFLAAPHVMWFAVIAAGAVLATCGTYAHIRGKPPFRSMFPAAPPLIAAGLTVFLVANAAP